jgi:regulator of protease activity HflC (stomatin/prohibitin superfamily)
MVGEIILFVSGIILTCISLSVVPDSERVAILWLGQFESIRGPGIVWTTPFVEKRIRVVLDRDIPNWRSLRSDQLASEIERFLTILGFIK